MANIGYDTHTFPLITDLPNEALTKISEYLPDIHVALLAIALTAPSASQRKCNRQLMPPSAASKAIVKSVWEDAHDKISERNWEVFDFVGVEKKVANNLNDDDVADILVCIDAVNKVKRFLLTGCIGIAGRGMEPLRGSVVLEQIDLSLVKKHENPIKPGRPPLISEAVVLSILDSIVDADGNSLKHIQLPRKWLFFGDEMRIVDNESLLHRFLMKFNRLLTSRPFNCSKLRSSLGTIHNCSLDSAWREQLVDLDEGEEYGLQPFTCYHCLLNFCQDWEPVGVYVEPCTLCAKYFCSSCNPTPDCENCLKMICNGCMTFVECECDSKYCAECNATCTYCNQSCCRQCSVVCACDKTKCPACQHKELGGVQSCDRCFGGVYCDDCTLKAVVCKPGGRFCSRCLLQYKEHPKHHQTMTWQLHNS